MQETEGNKILVHLRSGSEKLLREIYTDNREKFLNFARKYQLSEDDNIDIYQDAYVIFYDNVMQGKLTELNSSVSTYLFSIGKYLIFDRMRKNKKTVGSHFPMEVVGKADVSLEELSLGAEELSAEQKLLQKYFATLGTQCKELLNLFYYRGFTIQEIVESGGYNNENVVKAAKSRCMKTLKERIKADAD
ncbi:sigma-70 family RNA polymerase sigma factor [Maribacter algicola]|uniref:Sigma-70 family RNA polymerase sigma factor n=1 Tax=Maribacter algicola TaxID=2498892 RepID=A0A426RP20_9FLAO|nr:sigma-70 family RNA polymerase sigma factor [Maribacter algicola]RRQ50705.1 sigma-70 family RNA polymerase sigma factor [Maribacter algicola]